MQRLLEAVVVVAQLAPQLGLAPQHLRLRRQLGCVRGGGRRLLARILCL